MKLTKEQKQKIKDEWGDWESVHSTYDKLALARLKELDPEFYDDLELSTKNATFWYA